jgi:D-amino-acid dehydrogenase
MNKPHATIIGAGIVGISSAAFLLRAGFKVTVIDRVPPGEGCSFGNAGGIAFSEIMPTVHPRTLLKIPGWLLDPLGPLTIRWSYLPRALPWFLAASRNALPSRVKATIAARAALSLRTLSDFETILADAGVSDLLVKQDALRLYDTESEFAAEEPEREIKRAHGYSGQRLSPGEISEIEPAVARDFACGSFHGGWYFVRSPHRTVTSIARHVAASGGEILQDDVRAIIHDGIRATRLSLSNGEREIDRLVVCAGAYSGQLCAQIGERVLLEAERGYHLTIPDPGFELGRTVTYAKTPIAMTPMEMGLRLAGSDEFAGLDAPPNWKRADAHWTVAKRIFPALRPLDDTVTRWMGRRPGTPDGIPVIGPSRRLSNVWYGFGHSHMGLAWGPTTGRLIAELLGGRKSNIDLAPFRVDRF